VSLQSDLSSHSLFLCVQHYPRSFFQRGRKGNKKILKKNL
jgi:hypothetical protein